MTPASLHMGCWDLGGLFVLLGVGSPPLATPGGHWGGLLRNFGENHLLLLPGYPSGERRSPLAGVGEGWETRGGALVANVDFSEQPRAAVGSERVGGRASPGGLSTERDSARPVATSHREARTH